MEDLAEALGKRAYIKQLWGFYHEAIELYTTALKANPNDSRLLNNRCLCYIELKDYGKAMEDAESMIHMFPANKKAFFRKGEILAKNNKFEEAEEYFWHVLRLDPACEEARFQALEAKVSQICQGLEFSRKQGLQALNFAGNVKDARAALTTGRLQAHMKRLENIIYMSDSDEDLPVINRLKECDPLQDPKNPYHSMSLWVGNVPNGVTESFLIKLFSKYGRVRNVQVKSRTDNPLHFAFINFQDSNGPGKAIKHLQGFMVEGQKLKIKYPRNTKPSIPPRMAKFK